MYRRGLPFATMLASLASGAVGAQSLLQGRPSGVDVRAARQSVNDVPFTSLTEAATGMQADTKKKPILAGAMSFFVPGLGSYYAGHSRHAWTHLVVASASAAVMLVEPVGSALRRFGCKFNGGFDCDTDPDTGNEVAYWVFNVNLVWSIVSGVNDANAHNRRGGPATGGQISGDLFFEPEVRKLRTHGPEGPRQARTGVQLVSWKY